MSKQEDVEIGTDSNRFNKARTTYRTLPTLPDDNRLLKKRSRETRSLLRNNEKEFWLQFPNETVEIIDLAEEMSVLPSVNETLCKLPCPSNACNKWAEPSLGEQTNKISLPRIKHQGCGAPQKLSVSVLPSVNETLSKLPCPSNACNKWAEPSLGEQTNKISLPRIKHQGCGAPQKLSAKKLPPIDQCTLDEDEGEDRDIHVILPFTRPQQEMINAFKWLSGDKWEDKIKALQNIRCLATYHSEVLISGLDGVSLAVTKEVSNLRLKVSRSAINTLVVLFKTMKKHMDHEVDKITEALLHKTGESNKFIQKLASHALGIMVANVTPARAFAALMASGPQHRNVMVRKFAAEHLLSAMEQIGAGKLLSGRRDSVNLLLHMLVKLAQDNLRDTRYYGRKMLSILMTHPNFAKCLKYSVPPHDLKDIMERIKKHGIEEKKCEVSPIREDKKSSNRILRILEDNSPSDTGSRSGSQAHKGIGSTLPGAAEETHKLEILCKLLEDKDFQTRINGSMFLLDHCRNTPEVICNNIIKVFDAFVPRLRDYHKKVKQKALEVLALIIPLLRDALQPVLFHLLSAVTENLNSKHQGIYAAAIQALKESIAHLDNTSLLHYLALQVRSLSGQALLDVTEHLLGLVTSLNSQKPQLVKCYALPLLWFFLGKSALPAPGDKIKAVVTKFAQSLYQEMGSRLREAAAKKPRPVIRHLSKLLELEKKQEV